MKYYLVTSILFLSGQLISQPYLNETSTWKQYFRYSVYPPGVAFIEDIWITLDGDTTIAGTTYFKVLKTGFDTTDYLQGAGTDTYGTIYQYLDPIREGDKSIYAYSLMMQKEYLLYDFSAEVGDTLKSGNCKRDSVILIDTLYLGNVPRKQFHLPSPFPGDISTLVEGVGSTFGFYYHTCNVIPAPVLVYLQCFSQDGAVMQFHSGYDCNQLLLANEEVRKHDFSIYPNPFVDELEIHFPDVVQDDVMVSLANMTGAIVFQKEFSSPSTKERISTPDLPPGMYVVCVQQANGIVAQRVIKL